jgi:hypothetical protein
MSKQTAIDWLRERINVGLTFEQEVMFEALFSQAKEMERQQMNSIAVDWYEECLDSYDGIRTYSSFEQYYNQKYGGEQ